MNAKNQDAGTVFAEASWVLVSAQRRAYLYRAVPAGSQWEHCPLFDINFTPKNMSVAQLQTGFLKLVKELYSAQETQTRRRRFKRMLRTSPNFGGQQKAREQLLAA